MGRAVPLLAVLLVCACSLDRSGLGSDEDGGPPPPGDGAPPRDDGAPPRPDAGSDAALPEDAGFDAAVEMDACVAVAELCNGLDEDCDTSIDEAAACAPCEHRAIGAGTYLFCNVDRPWAEARGDCAGRGYDLVALDDSGEDRGVWAEARALRVGDWWIGLEDMTEEGTYVWVDGRTVWRAGTAIGYVNWRGGAPENVIDQDCIEYDGESSDGQWADSACGSSQPYVCEL